MKAAVCYEFGKPLVVEEVALDPPKAGDPERPAWRVVSGKWVLKDGGYGGTPDPDAEKPSAVSVLELPSAAGRLDVFAKLGLISWDADIRAAVDARV